MRDRLSKTGVPASASVPRGARRTLSAKSSTWARRGIAAAVFFAWANSSGVAAAQTPKPFMDYIKPRPITCSPLSSETWGVDGVLPRDLCNGIESARGAGVPPEYYYWDGQILKAQGNRIKSVMM